MLKNKRLTGFVTMSLCLAFLIVLSGNVYALPFNLAGSFALQGLTRSVVIGDFNDDDNSDLAVANSSTNKVSILLGGDGQLEHRLGQLSYRHHVECDQPVRRLLLKKIAGK